MTRSTPLGLLRSIRDALRPGGRYLCLEINCSDRAAANVGPVATLLYGFSVLYCMTTSLAEGGEGLGTLGLAPGPRAGTPDAPDRPRVHKRIPSGSACPARTA